MGISLHIYTIITQAAISCIFLIKIAYNKVKCESKAGSIHEKIKKWNCMILPVFLDMASLRNSIAGSHDFCRYLGQAAGCGQHFS